MARAIFHPQAWQNDYAISVDPEGPTTWDVGDVPDDMEDDTYPSDELRFHQNTPEWVREWSGPFYIEIDRSEWDDTACNCAEAGCPVCDEDGELTENETAATTPLDTGRT